MNKILTGGLPEISKEDESLDVASEYLGWVFLGTIAFVVISILYEAVKQLLRLRRKKD